MPNRIIKESTFTSDKIAQLSDFEFRLWVGLITQADDAGRGDARPAIIKGRIFALRERTALKDIDNALRALAAYGCVILYTVDGRPYYEFPNWTAHQRVRNALPKYPGIDEKDPENDSSPQLAATRRGSPQLAATRGLNPIQSNTNPNPIQSKDSTRFAPPTLEDVKEYCRERNNSVDPERFVDFYASKGWKIGKDSMKDWKAAVRNWERSEKQRSGISYPASPAKTAEEDDRAARELLEKLKGA